MSNPWLDIPLEDYEGHVEAGFSATGATTIELSSGKSFCVQHFRA